MINICQLHIFGNYKYFPRTCLHLISAKMKGVLMCIYIIFIPYLSISILIYIILYLCIIFLCNNINDIYQFSWQVIIFTIMFFIISSLALTSSNYLAISIIYQIKLRHINLFFPLAAKKYSNIITFFIPTLITRSFIILIAYYLYYQLIKITTQGSEILSNNLQIITSVYLSRIFVKKIIFILIMTSEYIFLIESKVQNITISLFMRGQLLKQITCNEIIKLGILLFKLITKELIQEINHTSQIIFTREILFNHRNNWLID